jgi:hypothetical protein
VSFEVGQTYKTKGDGPRTVLGELPDGRLVVKDPRCSAQAILHDKDGRSPLFVHQDLIPPKPPVVVSDAVAQAYNNNAYRNYYSKVALAAAITVYLAEQDSK